MGVEPTYQPWEGRILPMNYTRVEDEAIIADPRGKFNIRRGSFFCRDSSAFSGQCAANALKCWGRGDLLGLV